MNVSQSPSHPRHHLLTPLAHGVVDYLIVVALFAAPKVVQFGDKNMAVNVAIAHAVTILFYSLITDYPLGVLRFLPFSGHRLFDLLIGTGLLTSPLIFNIDGGAAVTFFVLGAVQIASVFLTRRPRPTSVG